jgi:hypothetical protein
MKIKEKYYHNRIIHLLKEYNENFGLLNESKKEILMDKLGLKESLAKVFDEVGKKLSVWLANKYLKYYYDLGKSYAEREVTHKETLDFAKHKLNTTHSPTDMRRTLTSIMDYIQVGLNGNKSSLDDLSIFDIFNKSKEWHDQLNVGQGSINYIENAPILIDFRDENGEGYYWADLNVKNSPEECDRMGHCGRSSYGYLYSLRSDKVLPGGKYKLNKSHLTAAISSGDGILYQLKGPKNSKPKEEYHQYIEPLFYYEDDFGYLIKGFGTEYGAEQDFKLSDLPDATIRKIYNDRPELFNTRGLQRKLGEMGIIDVEPLQTRFVLELDPSNVSNYLKGDTYKTYEYKDENGKLVKKRVGRYETIVSDNIRDEVWDMDFGSDWKTTLKYEVNDDNKKFIEQLIDDMIVNSGDEVDQDISLEQKIENYDDYSKITQAINNAENNILSGMYVEHLRDAIKSALEEYGSVFEFNDESIKIQIDLKDFNFSNDYLDEYYEICDGNPACVFSELTSQDIIEMPKPNFDKYWSPSMDTDEYNEALRNRLNEI